MTASTPHPRRSTPRRRRRLPARFLTAAAVLAGVLSAPAPAAASLPVPPAAVAPAAVTVAPLPAAQAAGPLATPARCSPYGAIGERWSLLGGASSVLGPCVDDEAQVVGARAQHFAGGSVFWSPATGAWEVRGAIRDLWAGRGWETSFLGLPVTGEIALPDGAFSVFQGGSVYWTRDSGAHSVQGAIRDAWGAQGWERGALGYPVSDEYAVPGGRRSDFERGSISWDAARGTTTTTVTEVLPAWALALPPTTTQALRAVSDHRWCPQVHCVVTQTWQRQRGVWRLLAEYRAQSGPSGFAPPGQKVEGDGRTPSGVYRIATTFSTDAVAPTRMPWRQRFPTSTVSGRRTAATYNTWIEEPGRTDGTRPATRYGLWVDYNNARLHPLAGPAPVIGRGSGIFFHTAPAHARFSPSAGCIQIGVPQEMADVLRWLDPAADPRVVLNV